jgi:trans-aconitate 2-methyltransferase
MNWNPEQYLKFADARQRPALDLLARLIAGRQTASSISAVGPATSRSLLAERWPGCADHWRRQRFGDACQSRCQGADDRLAVGGNRHWQAEVPPDLIFSNAALHWLDDHPHLLPQLLGQLAAGGVLAVQMPANFNAPSHRILRELAAEADWREVLGGVRMGQRLSAAEYQQLLMPHCRHLELWETTYWQLLSGDDAVFEWMKGSTLVPYLAQPRPRPPSALSGGLSRAAARAYPQRPDGHTLFPFKRIFFVAQR